MVALDRAVPLPQADHVARLVGQNLYLNVPGGVDILLHVNRPVPKGGLPLGHRQGIGLGHLIGGAHQPDAPAAAAGTGLEHHRIADLRRCRQRRLGAGEHLGARNDLQAVSPHDLLQPGFVAELLHALRRGSDEHQPIFPAEGGKVGVFRQEAIPRVDGLGPGDQGGGDHPLLVEVALPGGSAAHAVALICQGHVEGVPVRLGVDGHGGNAHLLAGPDDPDGDLPPVGNQDL